MNRRGFLAAAAAAAVAPKALIAPADGVPLFSAIHPIPFNPPSPALTAVLEEVNRRSGLMTAAVFRAQLADGLNAVFSEMYANTPAGWQELFESPEAQLDDDALEVIEIWRPDEQA
jgi:hypothetical protein